MDMPEAKRLALDLMRLSEAVYVSTIDGGGYPHTRAMFNLRRPPQFPKISKTFGEHEGGFLVYLTTNTSSSKVAHLRANPKISVYYCLPAEWRGLMLGGEIEFLPNGPEKEKIWEPGWEMYYPGGVNDPDHTVLKLLPSRGKYYHQLQNFSFELGNGS